MGESVRTPGRRKTFDSSHVTSALVVVSPALGGATPTAIASVSDNDVVSDRERAIVFFSNDQNESNDDIEDETDDEITIKEEGRPPWAGGPKALVIDPWPMSE